MRWTQLSLASISLFLLPAVITVSNAQGGLGESCTALDGTYTGSNPSCLSGFCRSGTCSDPSNVVDVGQPCTANNECANAEAADQPPYCGGRPGNLALICGGTSSSCYALDGSGTGASPVCASGQCRDYQCTAADAVAPGGTCTANYDCALTRDFCSNGICTDVGTSCTATDGSSTGDSDTCDAGFCRLASCAAIPTRQIGETCTADNVCVGQESYDIPTFCAGEPGQAPICGGPSAYCITTLGQGTGIVDTCFSGYCKSSQCTLSTPLAEGAACTADYQCPGDIFCSSGFCTGGGTSCTANDGSATGDTTTCTSGFCRQNSCASVPARQLGETCVADNVCVGQETFGETPIYCAGDASTPVSCGGPSAYCISTDGAGTGPSATCFSGLCKSSQCTRITPVAQGGACTADYQCPGDIFCTNGFCTGGGTSCTANDGSSTGDTTACTSGFCRQNSCASVPARQLGETCTADNVCVGQETFGETPIYCAGDDSTPVSCGGPSAYCISADGAGTGPSATCFSGQCRDSQCTRTDPVSPGGACSGSFQCGTAITCINGFCTGGEDTCQATDGNSQAIGPSTDCTSNFCRAGSCSNVPVAVLGDICDEDRDCSGSDNNPFKDLLYCGEARANVRRCGSVGAYCVATDGTGTGSAPDLCVSGQCVNYACIDVAPSPGLPRRASLPTQHVIKPRPCPKDFEPCPLYPKGFECIDIMNDIESCGGCVGRGMVGVDCSADVHAREISCVQGRCIISCEPGFFLAAENNTCILK